MLSLSLALTRDHRVRRVSHESDLPARKGPSLEPVAVIGNSPERVRVHMLNHVVDGYVKPVEFHPHRRLVAGERPALFGLSQVQVPCFAVTNPTMFRILFRLMG